MKNLLVYISPKAVNYAFIDQEKVLYGSYPYVFHDFSEVDPVTFYDDVFNYIITKELKEKKSLIQVNITSYFDKFKSEDSIPFSEVCRFDYNYILLNLDSSNVNGTYYSSCISSKQNDVSNLFSNLSLSNSIEIDQADLALIYENLYNLQRKTTFKEADFVFAGDILNENMNPELYYFLLTIVNTSGAYKVILDPYYSYLFQNMAEYLNIDGVGEKFSIYLGGLVNCEAPTEILVEDEMSGRQLLDFQRETMHFIPLEKDNKVKLSIKAKGVVKEYEISGGLLGLIIDLRQKMSKKANFETLYSFQHQYLQNMKEVLDKF